MAFRSIIKNVVDQLQRDPAEGFQHPKLIRDQGYQDVSGPIRFVGASIPTARP